MMVTLVANPISHDGIALRAILNHPGLVEHRTCGGVRYVVVADRDGLHRMCLPDRDAGLSLVCLIEPGKEAELRIAATARFCRHFALSHAPAPVSPIQPTQFQRHRLIMLLEILDRINDPTSPHATVRAVARDLVYRNLRADRAAEWKSSSQRRQTQRLIFEAQQLTNGGYRALLKGKMLKKR